MATLLTDELWEAVAPLLPARPRSPLGGAPRRNDRACLRGILFSLKTGGAGQDIPTDLGDSGSTCWRRFAEWSAADVWPRAHDQLLGHRGRLGEIDLARGVLDSASVRAVKGGRTPAGTRPTGGRRARSGTSVRPRTGCRCGAGRGRRTRGTTPARSNC